MKQKVTDYPQPSLLVAAFRRYAMMIGMALLPISFLRVQLLRLCGVRIGKGCWIGFHVSCDTNYAELISIGDNVVISHNVSIYTHTIAPVNSLLSQKIRQVKPVKIGDGAWVAVNSIVLPGAIIEENCMIGAGAVVSGVAEKDSLYVGNPARKIKEFDWAK